jgi:GNAT superfamily N-acetyltransferase
MANPAFEIIPDAADDLVRPLLREDLIWNCFALADLAPLHRQYARVPVALAEGGAAAGGCLIYERGAIRSLMPFGAAEAIRAVLASVALPVEALLMLRREDRPVFEEQYIGLKPAQQMIRMAVDAQHFRPAAAPSGYSIRPLNARDYPAGDALYQLWPGGPAGVADYPEGDTAGSWHDNGELHALAALMAVSAVDRVGLVGGVFTHPDARGKGLAKAVTTAVCARMFDLGCELALLNVLAANEPAIRAYAALGFAEATSYVTVHGRLKACGQPGRS